MQSRSLCCLTAGAHQRKPSLRLQLWPKCTTRRGPLETVLRVASKQSRKPKTDSYGWARIQVCFASMGSISNATILLPVRICGRGRLPAYSRHRMGGRGCPRYESDSIEAHQSRGCSDPQISVRRLYNGSRNSIEYSILQPP